MDKRRFNGDASQLAGYFTKPYRQDAVIAAARTLAEPFTMREVADAADLPRHIVHRCLCRLVRKGILVRFKVTQTIAALTGGQHGRTRLKPELRWIPGGRKVQVYAYRFVERRA